MNKKVKKMVQKLIFLKKTISVMESCTGGSLANEITNVSGSSEIFKFGAVTYSNDFKLKFGVLEKSIKTFSVYSKQVSKEMSINISKYVNSDFGIGITGKLKKYDPNNNFGEDDVVFFSIFEREKKLVHNYSLKLTKETREENKQDILTAIAFKMLEILK